MTVEDDLFKRAEDLLDDIRDNIPEPSEYAMEQARRALYWAIYDKEPYWTD